jgi:hypothetical protein
MPALGMPQLAFGLIEHHDLPDAVTLAHAVEAFVYLIEPELMGEQLVHRQLAGTEQRHVVILPPKNVSQG